MGAALANTAVRTPALKQVGGVLNVPDQATGGAITLHANNSIEQFRAVVITQTTAGQTLTLPDPKDTSIIFSVDLHNKGSASFTLLGQTIAAGSIVRPSWNGTAWILPTAAASKNIPTVQAGLGTAVAINTLTEPSNIHINSASGAVTWNVASTPDGTWHYIMNVGTVSANVVFSGATEVYLRDGTANNTPANDTLVTSAGEAYLVHVTDNAGAKYVNIVRLDGRLATTNGLQRVNQTTTVLLVNNTNQNYTVGTVLQEGDLLEVAHTFNNNAAEAQSFWVRVAAGTTQRTFPWADPTNNVHYFTFPATLTNTFQVRQATSGSSPRITQVKVWRDAANGFVVAVGQQVLTARQITGSVTSRGFDGATLPYRIPLTAGQVLATVTLNGVATTDFDANTGIVMITPNGADITVAHTTAVGATFTSWQRIANLTPALGINTVAKNLDFGVTLQEGDLITLTGAYTNSGTNEYTLQFRVKAGVSLLQEAYPATNHIVTLTFPATLTSIAQISHGDGNTSFRVNNAIVYREAANKVAIPTATTVRDSVTVQIDGVTWGNGFTGTSMRVMKTPAAGKYIATAVADNGCTAGLADPETGAIELAIPTGTTGTVNITTTSGDMNVSDLYIGRFDNQAGDTGHVFTPSIRKGSRITTSDHKDLMLANGEWEVSFGIGRHFGPNTWRNTILNVDGSQVDSVYSGHDGSNWEGTGQMKVTVDATTANKVVRVYRGSSVGNGNTSGWIRIERIRGNVVPNGVTTRDQVTLTANGGALNVNGAANAILFTGTSARVDVPVPAGQIVQSVTAPAGLTVSIADSRTGALEVAVTNGTTGPQNITVTFATPGAGRVLQAVNAGVPVTLGTLRFQMASGGNRSMQIASATGAAINVVIGSVAPSSSGASPAGIGTVSLTLAAGGAFQYIKGHNFGAQGQFQQCLIQDQTNNRWYQMVMEVGASFNNNVFSGFEIL